MEDIAAAVGNRAFTAFVLRDAEASSEPRVSAQPHPQLHPGTPAWAEEGEMVLGPAAFQLSAEERADVVHHETIHVLQQRLAPTEESGAARARAERLADGPRGALPPVNELRSPAPRLLAAPIKGKPATGFDRLFAGDGEIIGEVVESGVTVRTSRTYQDLAIEAPVDPKSKFGTASMSDLQFLSCENRSFSTLQKVAKKMRSVAQGVARVNSAIAAGSPWRVEMVFVVNEASRLHFADGKALITLATDDFNNAAVETAVHEASHAVFESHSHPDRSNPEALAPDTLALRISDLFLRLSNTRLVPVPSLPFKKQRPPLKAKEGDAERPAGLVMVTDGLWSGGAATDGHPWDGPDEFFASAHGAFETDSELLRQLIAHFASADASIKQSGAELFALLKSVKDPKAQKSLAALDKSDEESAKRAIRGRESQASTIKQRLGAILDPEKLPPSTVTCSTK